MSKKVDGRKNNGGNRTAGRKSKAEELKANSIMRKAMKQIYATDDDEEAKLEFIKQELMTFERGKMFIAEHMFGKPKEIVETTTIDATDSLTEGEMKEVISQLKKQY